MRVALVSAHGGASLRRADPDRDPARCPADVNPAGQPLTGTAAHIARLARELAALGHEVRVHERWTDPDEPHTVERDGYQLVRIPAGPPTRLPTADLLAYLPELGRALAGQWRAGQWTPDVVHGHFWPGGLAAASAVADSRIPLVQTFHSVGSHQQRMLGSGYRGPQVRIALERALGRVVDAAVAQCTEEVDELARLGRDRASVVLIPPGVDTARFTPDPDPPRRRRRRLLAVGDLVPGAGHDALLGALRLVGDADLIIVGGPPRAELADDPGARRLIELAHRYGVADRIELAGLVPAEEMPQLYRSVDVVVCAARYAPVGTVALEAMACGIPVVGYAHGGVADCVVDSVTGRLVPVGDVRALGVTVRRLLADEAERFAFGHAGIDRVRCRYSWERTAAAVERLYQRVLGLRGTPEAASTAAVALPDGESVAPVELELDLTAIDADAIEPAPTAAAVRAA
ncbi:glycosyltransferase [Solwaraspora sp. WMMD791]|uniref:glycosyltransferase n=1 Tax=Solwaraspora sp. WMMD791 TaxID=3016086 RepID=UPI00249A717F|nr:glycosyltransferase [Solwaraspora sp. WMMD791]WFE26913.1 glycosyltransferase [Solwaraspora sp. WMMD791]